MTDRWLSRALNLTILLLICGTAGAAVVLAYHGLLEMLCRQPVAAAIRLVAAPAFALAAHLLIRNRADLSW